MCACMLRACVRTCVRACVRACVRVPVFCNYRLDCDSGVSRIILGNMITNAHSIHGPCLYFQRVM